MKSLMFFIYSLRMGGSEKACIRMANALSDHYKVTICTVFGTAGLEHEVSGQVNLVHRFPKFIRGFAKFIYLLKPLNAYKYLLKGKYDIEIAVGDGLESFVISGSPNPNKYSWIHMNFGEFGPKNSDHAFDFNQFKKIICVSEANKKAFIKEMDFKGDTQLCYPPSDLSEIKRRSVEFDVFFKNITLASVGRMEFVKGYDRLINAIKQINDINFSIVFIGGGTQKLSIQNQIDVLGLSDRVKLIGSKQNPYPYIKAADAIICSSHNESFGFSVVEAMALRTPVIATKCGGIEEIIQDETQGILCENSIEGIKYGIEQFLNCQHKINVENAYKRAKYFDIDNCVKRFIEIIDG